MKRLVSAIFAVFIIMLQCMCVCACADGNTTLTTTVPESFTVKVEISGNAYLLIGETKYYNGDILSVPYGSSVEFRLFPGTGLHPYSVKLNGQAIQNDINSGKYVTPQIKSDSVLTISSVSSITPATGDPSSIFQLLFICAASFILFFAVCIQIKKIYNRI